MVTWTFDLVTMLVSLFVGFLLGMGLFLLIEWRDGGAWDKGFSAGFEAKKAIERLDKLRKEADRLHD